MQKKVKKTQKRQLKRSLGPGMKRMSVRQAFILNMNLNTAVLVKSDGSDATPGNEDAEIEEIGYGQSEGDDSEHSSDEEESDKIEIMMTKKKAGKTFGKEHLNVVYEEQRIEVIKMK